MQPGKPLKINDLFWTFQGEGAHWGRRALFVRMPFCNLHCPWCDTEFNSHKPFTEDEFLKFADREKARFAVITGGEPMMNKDTPRVVSLLKSKQFELACETNGTFPIVDGIDFVTCSPKRDADFQIHELVKPKVSELKYVVDHDFDLNVLRDIQKEEFTRLCRLSLSPEFNNFKASLDTITEFIKENPRWRISLQTHKWMQIP